MPSSPDGLSQIRISVLKLILLCYIISWFTCNQIRIAGSACCRSSARTCSLPRPPWSSHPPENWWRNYGQAHRFFVDDENPKPAFNDRLWSHLTRWTSKIFSIATTFDDKVEKKCSIKKVGKVKKILTLEVVRYFRLVVEIVELGSWNLKVVGRALKFQYKEAQSVSGKRQLHPSYGYIKVRLCKLQLLKLSFSFTARTHPQSLRKETSGTL